MAPTLNLLDLIGSRPPDDGPESRDDARNDSAGNEAFSDIEIGQLQALDARMRGHIHELEATLASLTSDPALKDDPHVAELTHQIADLQMNVALVQRTLESLHSARGAQQRHLRQRIRVALPQLVQLENLEYNEAQSTGMTVISRGAARHARDEEISEHGEARRHTAASPLNRALCRLLRGAATPHHEPSWIELQRQRFGHLMGIEEHRHLLWLGTGFATFHAQVDEAIGNVGATVVSKGAAAANLLGEIGQGHVLYGGTQILKATVRNLSFGVITNADMNGVAQAVSTAVGNTIAAPVVGLYHQARSGLSSAYHAVVGDRKLPAVPARPIAIRHPVLAQHPAAPRPAAAHAGALNSLLAQIRLPEIHMPWEHAESISGPSHTPSWWDPANLLAIA